MSNEILVAFVGFVGVLIGVTFQKMNHDKAIFLENITKERKVWRDTIRSLTEELNKEDADYKMLKVKFQIRLNPLKADENQDNEIIKIIDDLILDNYKGNKEDLKSEFNKQIALLLKHDWERVKLEAKSFSFFPYGALTYVLLTISLFIVTCIYYPFRGVPLMIFVQRLLGNDLLFYIMSVLFTMGWVYILYRNIKVLVIGKHSDWILKVFKIPIRESNTEKKDCKKG